MLRGRAERRAPDVLLQERWMLPRALRDDSFGCVSNSRMEEQFRIPEGR